MFSRIDAVKRHQKQNCRILKEDEGLETLYDHVLKRSTARLSGASARIAELEAERDADQRRLIALESRLTSLTTGDMSSATIDASVTNIIAINTLNVTVNVFGQENTAHIPVDKVRQILSSAVPDRDIRASALNAICEAALLIYSDPDHPENITCYVPNQRNGTALVHGDRGWEIQPVPLILPSMTQNSVGFLFDNQPLDGDVKAYEAILAYLRDSEREIVCGAGQTSCGTSIKSILIRNKDLLARALKTLPVAGDL